MGYGRYSYKTSRTRFCASVRIGPSNVGGTSTIQINFRTPAELVRALRDYGAWADGRVTVLKLYTKGRD